MNAHKQWLGFFLIVIQAVAMRVALLPASAQPVITNQPTNQVVALGGTLTLSVAANDSAAGYQWFKDGRWLGGATNLTLSVTNAAVADSGIYYAVVTNVDGMVISLPVAAAVGDLCLLAWGYNNIGQLGNDTTTSFNRPVKVASKAVTGSAGQSHSLFVTPDGTLWTMGNNANGQLGIGTTPTSSPRPISMASNVVAVAAGQSHSMFVTTDGTLWAMGANNFGQLGNGTTARTTRPVSVASNVVAVAAGLNHSLFVTTDGTLWAMGYNGNGQLGIGTTISTNRPVCVASNVVAVATGQNHSLFVTTEGTLWAMGSNGTGQLGDGTTTSTNLPVCVASNVVAVAAGQSHSLFVATDETLWAMGYNNYGQLGNGTTTSTNRPVCVASNVVAVASGQSHSLFVTTERTLWTMGLNVYGQLGIGTTKNTNTPTLVSTIISLAMPISGSSAQHSFAISQLPAIAATAATQDPMPVTATNAVLNGMTLPSGLPAVAWFDWGLRGSFTDKTSPVNVGAGPNVVRVSAMVSGLSNTNVYQCRLVVSNAIGITTGFVHWFRVDQAPKVAAWGLSNYGELEVPNNLTNVVALAGGAVHSLALQADGTVRAWGNNVYGECNVPTAATNVVALGTGYGSGNGRKAINLALRNDGTMVPWGDGVSVLAGLENVVAVAAGDQHCLALQADGTVITWGLSPTVKEHIPDGLTNVVAIGGGVSHCLALLTNGTVRAWNRNAYDWASVPASVTNVIAIVVGSFHNLALRADGTVVEWEQIGSATIIPGLSNVVAVAAGGFHNLALKDDGTVVAWGSTFNGQTTIPEGLSNVVNIACGGFHSLALGGNALPSVNTATNTGLLNQDLAITPTVFDANNDLLTCRVVTLPTQGDLYQFNAGTRGLPITAPNTVITDVSNRVVFVPVPEVDGNPYTTFELKANDGQADSAPGSFKVNIIRTPQNLTAQNLSNGLQLRLMGTANHPYILQSATNLTPPINWKPMFTNVADATGAWQITDTNLNTAQRFYRAVGQ